MDDKIETIARNGDINELHVAAVTYAVQVRAKLTTGSPGDFGTMLRQFKTTFDLLYSMTCDEKDIIKNDKELLICVNRWLNHKTKKPSKQYASEGLKLFYQYKQKLKLHAIIGG